MKRLEDFVGNTPLVQLQRLPGKTTNVILAKLEGNNPAGSVKDRPALFMIKHAEARGEIKPGDTLIEATSGNTGIALAMAAAMQGYRMVLVMPEHLSLERRAVMKAFGAELVLVTQQQGMEGARDLADKMEREGKGKVLDQFANPDNPLAHYEGTGPEIWRDTEGKVTHFVSSMGTTGTIMGVSRYLKEKNPKIQIVGVQPSEGSQIPGIRAWPKEYLPKIYDAKRVDRIMEVTQKEAEEMTRRLAREEGIFCGISSGGATLAAAQAGAEVCHVDGSKVAIGWARDNAEISGLKDKPIRWILDDVKKFVSREIKRNRKYDGIIMDPPAFGHGPDKELWKFEKDFPELLDMCGRILSDKPLFFLINAYASGYSAIALKNNLDDLMKDYKGEVEIGELSIAESDSERLLPCGIFGRWSAA